MSGKTVLWDLDGTLTNSAEGIIRSQQHVLHTLGHPVPEADFLRQFIGPPLEVTFARLLDTDDRSRIVEARTIYRERYDRIGKFENIMFDDIPETLTAVSAAGARQFVATSKLERYSVDIIRHFGLDQFFGHVHGSQEDGTRGDKGELISYILATEGLDPARTVMVGDRKHDIVGALKNNVPVIGVLWGFGDRAELEEAGATAIADKPADIPGIVARLLA